MVERLHSQEVTNFQTLQESSIEWAKLRSEAARLESDWAWQKRLMESTKVALESQIELIENDVSLLETQMNIDVEAVGRLSKQSDVLSEYLDTMSTSQSKLKSELLRMRDQLPPRLNDSLELAYLSIVDDRLTDGECMQFIITIVNRCFQFNKSISYFEEVMSFDGADGESVVDVLYWGISHAYALDRKSGISYMGRSDGRKWIWEEQPGLSGEIRDLIDVFSGAVDPHYVSVPVRLRTLRVKLEEVRL